MSLRHRGVLAWYLKCAARYLKYGGNLAIISSIDNNQV